MSEYSQQTTVAGRHPKCEKCGREREDSRQYTLYYAKVLKISDQRAQGNVSTWRETVTPLQSRVVVICDDCVWQNFLRRGLLAILGLSIAWVFFAISAFADSWWWCIGVALCSWWIWAFDPRHWYSSEWWKQKKAEDMAIDVWRSRLQSQGYDRFYRGSEKYSIDRGKVWGHHE